MLISSVNDTNFQQNPDADRTASSQSATAGNKTDATSKTRSDTERTSSRKESRDQYIPGRGESESSAGIYRLEKDGNGKQRIVSDRPDEAKKVDRKARAAAEPSKKTEPPKRVKGSEKDEGGGESTGKVDTGSVDREIKQLKEKKQQLQQQLNSARSDDKREKLEKQLKQVEAELSRKDNDSYRKRHSSYTQSA